MARLLFPHSCYSAILEVEAITECRLLMEARQVRTVIIIEFLSTKARNLWTTLHLSPLLEQHKALGMELVAA